MAVTKLKTLLVITSIGLVTTSTAVAQTTTTPKRLEVVSIKPNKSVGGNIVLNPEPNGRFVASNETAKGLLRFAFLVFGPMDEGQLVGGPDWIDSDRFDIQGQAGGPLSFDDMSLAVRAMLEDRFQLKTHREKRELPVYSLVVAKDGSKMKFVDAPPPFNPADAPPISPGKPVTPPPGMIFRGLNNVIGSAIQSEQLASVLSSLAGRLVIDKTDLKGYFDLKLEFAPQNLRGNFSPSGGGGLAGVPNVAAEPQGPSIFTAVQEQLGLRLEPSRSSVEVIVIDSIQKPSEN
jgi:uncharacterized protein (TIGR03435 family)